MAGKNGFIHKCQSPKVNISSFKKGLKDSPFSPEQIAIIWDFYVSRSFAASTGLLIELVDYGWKNSPSKVDGLPKLEEDLASAAGIDSICFIRAKTIKDTLSAMDLSGEMICVEHPRAVLKQNHNVKVDENEQCKIESSESRIVCLFRHIRNSLAHGNTYFFENGRVLLIDKDGNTITAAILIQQRTLLDWISVVDYNQNFYVIKQAQSNEDQESPYEQK